MALDFTRIETLWRQKNKNFTAVEKRMIAGWLDMSRWAPEDESARKFYYDGIMGNKKLYVMTYMEPMPSMPKPSGGFYSGCDDYHIIAELSGQFWDIRFTTAGQLDGAKSRVEKNGKSVPHYYGYTITGVYQTEAFANIQKMVYDYMATALAS